MDIKEGLLRQLLRIWLHHWMPAMVVSISCITLVSASLIKYQFYILTPGLEQGGAELLSLADNNTLNAGETKVILDRDQSIQVSGYDLSPGTVITATGPFSVVGKSTFTTLPVPQAFAGTEFVVPHDQGNHTYYLFSPDQDARVSISVGINKSKIEVPVNQVITYSAGEDNQVAGLISASTSILVAHRSQLENQQWTDAYPVPPVGKSLYGIQSEKILVAARRPNTHVTAYASNGKSTSMVLHLAGDQALLNLGTGLAHGQGPAVHIIADQPIAAVQSANINGRQLTAFWDTKLLSYLYGIPVDSQFIAIACPQADTVITLSQPDEVRQTRSCHGDGWMPGKVYFGSPGEGRHIKAASILESSKPIYTMYKSGLNKREQNILGFNDAQTQVESPQLDDPGTDTTNNPLLLTGIATAGVTVRIYANDTLQGVTTAQFDGSFSYRAALVDGMNSIYATAFDGTDESLPTPTFTINYFNTIPRNQGGTITEDTVWTPGSPRQPYVIDSDITIESGATLTLQAGTVLQFRSGVGLDVIDGSLRINGLLGDKVDLTSVSGDLALPGDWIGIVVTSGSNLVDIDNARISWSTTAINIMEGENITVSNSEILSFKNRGIKIDGGSNITIDGNRVDRKDKSAGTGIYITRSSPAIEGNHIHNNQYGIHADVAAHPNIAKGNTISENEWGIRVSGNKTALGNPQPITIGNSIFNNTTANYDCHSFFNGAELDLIAIGNWWGSIDVGHIAQTIDDFSDNVEKPVVEFTPTLDAPSGEIVPGNYLNGPLRMGESNHLLMDETYQVVGDVIVSDSQSMIIDQGVRLVFSNDVGLVVLGAITVNGVESSRVQFTSINPDPNKGDWNGISINDANSTAIIEYADIAYAEKGIQFVNATCMQGSCSVSNSIIHNNTYGIYINGSSNPYILNSVITNNDYGIYIRGTNGDQQNPNPNPVINGNDIFGNNTRDLLIKDYGVGPFPNSVDVRNNWWGTPNPEQEANFGGDAVAVLDYTDWAQQALHGPVVVDSKVVPPIFSPNSDLKKDSTQISALFSQTPDQWIVEVRNNDGISVKSWTGNGSQFRFDWDGKNAGGQIVPSGEYSVEIHGVTSGIVGLIQRQKVVVDLEYPSISFVDDLDGSSVWSSDQIDIIGSVTDVHLDNYKLHYGLGENPTTWWKISDLSNVHIIDGVLGHWVINSPLGENQLENGLYTLRLTASDFAGNKQETTAKVILANTVFRNVVDSATEIQPLLGELVDVQFDLTTAQQAAVSLVIYRDDERIPVRTVTKQFSSGVGHNLSWDGRDESGQVVDDGLYLYVLNARDQQAEATYNLPPTGETIVISDFSTPSFNAHANEFWKQSINLSRNAKVLLEVKINRTSQIFSPIENKAMVVGEHLIFWDGRTPQGKIVSGDVTLKLWNHQVLRNSAIIVSGVTPTLTSTYPAPVVEIKSNPYYAVHSFGQFSQFAYRIDQDSNVTVKLLPPGIWDPENSSAVVLVDNEYQQANDDLGQPIDHSVYWDGIDPEDENNIIMADQGTYTFTIEATSVASNRSSLYRGSLQLHR